MLTILRPFVAMTLIGLGLSARLESCAKIPSWTLRNLDIETFDYVGSNGTLAVTFTYNLTNQTESITCPLHSNYRCTINGTKNDNSTIIDMQLGINSLYMTVWQVLSCGENGSTTFVGTSEWNVACNTIPFETHNCTADFATVEGVASV
ncbi:hypothetical protein F4777DRAFT_232190 [Nemania sp. FL0916]|nr:hypothetical protein F4777DRAFT_232190 [Nemania sp. FL0916]